MMMKKLLYTDTPTVSMSILRVACFPVMVKNLRMFTMKPNMCDSSVWSRAEGAAVRNVSMTIRNTDMWINKVNRQN